MSLFQVFEEVSFKSLGELIALELLKSLDESILRWWNETM
jgi:hypothetical protein